MPRTGGQCRKRRPMRTAPRRQGFADRVGRSTAPKASFIEVSGNLEPTVSRRTSIASEQVRASQDVAMLLGADTDQGAGRTVGA